MAEHLKLLLNTIHVDIDQDFLEWVSRVIVSAGHKEDVIGTFQKFTHQPQGTTDNHEYVMLHLNLPNQPKLRSESGQSSKMHFVHGTTPDGFRGIMTDKYIRPLYYAHHWGNKDSHGFMAFGHTANRAYPEDYNWHQARVMHKCWISPKNRANAMIIGECVGSLKTIKEGGVASALKNIPKHTVVHESRTKRWCIHSHRHKITAIGFGLNAVALDQ
jgi:hypothetical protein